MNLPHFHAGVTFGEKISSLSTQKANDGSKQKDLEGSSAHGPPEVPPHLPKTYLSIVVNFGVIFLLFEQSEGHGDFPPMCVAQEDTGGGSTLLDRRWSWM